MNERSNNGTNVVCFKNMVKRAVYATIHDTYWTIASDQYLRYDEEGKM